MWALHPLTIQVINNFHPLTSPFKVVSVTAVATMLPGHHAYERATETFETTTTATVHWKTEGWWSNGDGWKELKGNWVMESGNMLKILRVSSCIDDVLISTAWISIWCDLIALSSLLAWLACCKKLTCLPAPQECIRTIWYNQNLASVVPFLHPWKWCFLFPPTAPKLQTHPCSAMECSHAVFGHRMSGSKAARRMFLLKRVRDPNIKTSELQRLGSMLDDAVEGGQAVQLIQKLVEIEMGIQWLFMSCSFVYAVFGIWYIWFTTLSW